MPNIEKWVQLNIPFILNKTGNFKEAKPGTTTVQKPAANGQAPANKPAAQTPAANESKKQMKMKQDLKLMNNK
ncbi:hypothetical protein ACNR9V_08065 [Parageobacillus thermoglucosidasius]|uniref:hypothetical protein n=1 Tax=Parageobacillus thermoglucosidasius TaxID=1426 RepID=UPI003B66DE6A